MRVFAAMLLSMSLAAVPLLANDSKDPAKEESRVAVSSKAAVAVKPKETAQPENAVIKSELQDLRSLVQNQMQELEAQRAVLKAQQLKMEALEERLHVTPLESVNASVEAPVPIIEATPAAAIGSTPRILSATAAMPAQGATEEKPSPLYFKIGAAEFYPLGFMDMTGIYRTTQLGGIGTNFGSIAFNNSLPAGRISELRFSAQNSRIGLRTHAKFGEADVTGYLEADFLGFLPPNGNDTSNSDSLRMRLYWVDYKRGKFEMLAGQSWSFLTPNRTGLGALPGELFYSQDVDTNYQLGLTWARQSGIRFILHPTNNWAIGLALENPEQTLPGSVVLPPFSSTGKALNLAGGYGGQFDTNSRNTSNATAANNGNTPNLHPDVILKTAFDAKPGGHAVHLDVAGLLRSFRAVNLIDPTSTAASTKRSTIQGGGIAATLDLELVKNFRLITTGFYSYAGGRYIASTAGPDVIVRPDGSLSGIRSGSGIGGIEYQPNPKTVIYGYYSGAYFGRNTDAIVTTVTTPSGYGFYPGSAVLASGTGTCTAPAGSPNSANRYIYEPTFGLHYMLWRNPNYGDIRLMTQYSYVSRTPWFVASGHPHTAPTSMVYINLRYDIP